MFRGCTPLLSPSPTPGARHDSTVRPHCPALLVPLLLRQLLLPAPPLRLYLFRTVFSIPRALALRWLWEPPSGGSAALTALYPITCHHASVPTAPGHSLPGVCVPDTAEHLLYISPFTLRATHGIKSHDHYSHSTHRRVVSTGLDKLSETTQLTQGGTALPPKQQGSRTNATSSGNPHTW